MSRQGSSVIYVAYSGVVLMVETTVLILRVVVGFGVGVLRAVNVQPQEQTDEHKFTSV